MAYFVFALTFSVPAQTAKTLYTDIFYEVALQVLEDCVKQSSPTGGRIVFIGDITKFGTGSRLEFVVNETPAAEPISKLLATDQEMESIADQFLKNLKGKNANFEVSVLEKKCVQTANLNRFKMAYSATVSNQKIRSALYVVPVPEQKRIYSFIIAAYENDYEKWLPVAEGVGQLF